MKRTGTSHSRCSAPPISEFQTYSHDWLGSFGAQRELLLRRARNTSVSDSVGRSQGGDALISCSVCTTGLAPLTYVHSNGYLVYATRHFVSGLGRRGDVTP